MTEGPILGQRDNSACGALETGLHLDGDEMSTAYHLNLSVVVRSHQYVVDSVLAVHLTVLGFK